MEFLKFIRSVEELLYEVMTWLLFYPRTFWRVLRHPLALAAKAEAELSEPDEEQFTDLVSPPLFLMLSVLLMHMVEVGLHTQLASIGRPTPLASQVLASETNLLIFRAIAFSIFPMSMAVGLLGRQKRAIDRTTLRRPFYLQCFLATPFMVACSAATLFGQHVSGVAAGVVVLVATAWYLGVETAWFRSRLGIGRGRALAISVWLLTVALVLVMGAGLLIFNPTLSTAGPASS